MQNTVTSLEDVATKSLLTELARRGFDVFPAGLFQVALDDANRRTGNVRELSEDELESLAVIGRIAGVDFPDLVKTHGAVLDENLELSRRASRAESEASALAVALLGDLDTHATTEEEDDES